MRGDRKVAPVTSVHSPEPSPTFLPDDRVQVRSKDMQASYISFQYPKGRGQTCQARKPLLFHSSHLESSRIPPCFL